MRILGVDPGTLIVGYGCLELDGLPRDRSRESVERSAPAGAARAASRAATPIAHRVQNLAHVSRARLSVVTSGVLRLGRSADAVPVRLRRLGDELRRLLDTLQPDELALEDAYFGKSVQSALRIGESRGVILAEASRAGLSISQFAPARVKRSVTGSGAATKEHVARMVTQTLRLREMPETRDVTDALAVGLCCVEGKRGFHSGSS